LLDHQPNGTRALLLGSRGRHPRQQLRPLRDHRVLPSSIVKGVGDSHREVSVEEPVDSLLPVVRHHGTDLGVRLHRHSDAVGRDVVSVHSLQHAAGRVSLPCLRLYEECIAADEARNTSSIQRFSELQEPNKGDQLSSPRF